METGKVGVDWSWGWPPRLKGNEQGNQHFGGRFFAIDFSNFTPGFEAYNQSHTEARPPKFLGGGG